MTRYFNDYLIHADRSNHKYVYKEKVNGKWRYYYKEDLEAMKKQGTLNTESIRNASQSMPGKHQYSGGVYSADQRTKEAALKKELLAQKKKLRAQGVSADAAQTMIDDAYDHGKVNWLDTKNNAEIYKSSSKQRENNLNASSTNWVNRTLNSQRNTKNQLAKNKKKKKYKFTKYARTGKLATLSKSDFKKLFKIASK